MDLQGWDGTGRKAGGAFRALLRSILPFLPCLIPKYRATRTRQDYQRLKKKSKGRQERLRASKTKERGVDRVPMLTMTQKNIDNRPLHNLLRHRLHPRPDLLKRDLHHQMLRHHVRPERRIDLRAVVGAFLVRCGCRYVPCRMSLHISISRES